MKNAMQRAVGIVLVTAALSMSTAVLAENHEETVHRVKNELMAYPGLTGGYADGVVTLAGSVENGVDLRRIKKLLLSIDTVDEVRGSVTTN